MLDTPRNGVFKMETIIVEVISSLALIIVAILQVRSEKERKRRKQADEAKAKAEAERRKDDLAMSKAQGQVMVACGELAYVTSLAVTGGHTNGNVEEAQEGFTKARTEYTKLQSELAEKYLHSKEH